MRSAGAIRPAPGCTRRAAHPSCPQPGAPTPAGSRPGLRRLGERRLDLPALALGDRSVLDDPDPVADAAAVLLVMRHELGEAADVLLVARILHQPLDLHHDRLVHLVADHLTDQCPAHASLLHGFASRIPARTVSNRAMSRRSDASTAVFSSCPVERLTCALKSSSRSSPDFAFSSSAESSRSSLAFMPLPPAARTGSRTAACGPPAGAPPGRSRC